MYFIWDKDAKKNFAVLDISYITYSFLLESFIRDEMFRLPSQVFHFESYFLSPFLPLQLWILRLQRMLQMSAENHATVYVQLHYLFPPFTACPALISSLCCKLLFRVISMVMVRVVRNTANLIIMLHINFSFWWDDGDSNCNGIM